MRLGSFSFAPPLAGTLVTLLVLPVLLGLGFWQLDRARQKEAIQAVFQAQSERPPAPLASVALDDPASHFRQVIAVGAYDGKHQILLDNQIQDGQPGYHVFTPLRTPDSPEAVLVNRGWVPLGRSREQLPDIALADAGVTLSGRLAQPANPAIRLGGAKSAMGTWPRVVQFLDYQALADELGYPLAPAVILLDPQAESGYRRDWRPQFGGMGPEQHYGYAVQWFALAAALMVIYIAVNTHRSVSRADRPEQ